MEDAFLYLLRLIWEGSNALERTPPCMITARAYFKMAEAATFDLLKYAEDNNEYRRLQEACYYSRDACFKRRKWSDVAFFMSRFWPGVYDGFFDHTMSRESKYYERGYKMVHFGK